ncbi:MAG: hypothetical protein OK456_11355, partial [Thaumarchaeota archaeon]|nr:hypothetical protein [Nitrososphaerota archaeon]
SSFETRLSQFVSNGGGYIDTSFANSPNQQDVLAGLQASSTAASTTSSLTIVRPNKITSPYTGISYTPYWLRYKVSNITGQANPAYVLLKDSNNNPIITTHSYGAGIGVSLEMPYARLEYSGNSPSFDGVQNGSPRDSFVSLLINAIFYAAHKSNMLPILWETSYSQQQSWSPYLQFSVDGSPGSPVLVWASNNDTSSSPFDIHLNATFYGINTAGWVAINMLNLAVVASGTGSDIHIQTTVPPKEWLPIYILSDASNLQPIYSTAGITSKSVGASSASYTVNGPQSSSSWMVINSAAPVTAVSSTLTGSLTQEGSLSSLNGTQIGSTCTSITPSGGNAGACASFTNVVQQGWFYDQSDQTLYVHFQSGNAVTLSVTQTGSSSTSTSSSSSSTSSSSSSSSSSTSTSASSSSTTSATSSTSSSSATNTTSASSSTTSTSTSTFLSSSSSSSSSASSTSTTTSTTNTTSTTATSSSTSSSTRSTTSNSTTTSSNSTSSQSTTTTSTTNSTAQAFDIVLSPNSVSIGSGSGAQVLVQVDLSGGSPQFVTLNATGVPTGVSSSFSPPTGTTSFDSVLLLSASSSANPGTYEVSVAGTSGGFLASA